ncbi:translation initiation factor IF-2-like isoform X1 [Haliotis rufescens]|uniref:translation initiation factor IF-2-like isoform X1 n=1 Tax=Haliotis rufescens TaxID=6454 RepID=UPI00201F1352|nr:translation initiation factor IF-2-like isoform X1 [Haliotis rufescens]XP_046377024.2 translation initiation factor IF-2-like isoform X1 [Haliotis rufescens]
MFDYDLSIDPEELEPCPYDKAHMVRRKRMQYHLMKCRKNHTAKDFATCPFNATHEMPRPELRFHIATCPNKAVLEREIAHDHELQSDEVGTFKGCTDVPAYNQYEITCTESWDEEVNPHPRIGVNPEFLDKVKFKNITGMTPAEKRSFHKYLNPEHIEPEVPAQQNKENQTPNPDGKLRLPNNKPQAFSMYQSAPPAPTQQMPSAVFAYSLAQCGLGRGMGAKGGNAPRPGTTGLSMGRGRGVVNVAPQPVRPSAQPSPRTHKPVAQVVPATAQRPEHPYEDIPPCQPAPQPSINIQAPVGVFPDQTRVKPVGRGRSVGAPSPAACYAGLGGGDSPLTGGRDGKTRGSSAKASNSGQLCDWSALNLGSKSNGASFGTGHGRGSPRAGVNPAFVVPKVTAHNGNGKMPTKDWFDSAGGSSTFGTETQAGTHGIEGAKKKKQLMKKIRQIEALEIKMKAGQTLSTDEEVKIAKKEELEELLLALSI